MAAEATAGVAGGEAAPAGAWPHAGPADKKAPVVKAQKANSLEDRNRGRADSERFLEGAFLTY
jgi:hypothetical protein